MHTLAKNIIEEARTYVGVRWQHQARTRNAVDCVGLIVNISRTYKLADYDNATYRRAYTSDRITEHFIKAGCTPIACSKAQPSDILIVKDESWPCHCVILAENKETIIHSHALRRKVVEELYSEYWIKRTMSAWRFPEV